MDAYDSGSAKPPTPNGDPDVVVIGAGISGLSAAFRLQKAGWRVLTLEAAERPGGKMSTIKRDGFTFNLGPTTIPKGYTAVTGLAAEAGLTDVFSSIPSTFGVYGAGRLATFRDGPAGALDAIRTPMLSWRSKLLLRRLAADVRRWSREVGEDVAAIAGRDVESVEQYAKRRLNDEIYTAVLEPLMHGFYLDDAAKMSVADLFMTLAKFAAGGPLGYPSEGIAFIPNRLAEVLDVRMGARVSSAERTSSGVRVGWSDADGVHDVDARGCVLAVPAYEVTSICPDLDPRRRALLDSVEYCAILKGLFALRRKRSDLPTATLVAPSAGTGLGLVIEDSQYMANAAPPGKSVVSAFWVDSYLRETARIPDDGLLPKLISDVDQVFAGFGADVEFAHIERWTTASTARRLGFYRRVAELHASIDPTDPIQLAGDYLTIAGTQESAESGSRAAALLDRALRAGRAAGRPQ